MNQWLIDQSWNALERCVITGLKIMKKDLASSLHCSGTTIEHEACATPESYIRKRWRQNRYENLYDTVSIHDSIVNVCSWHTTSQVPRWTYFDWYILGTNLGIPGKILKVIQNGDGLNVFMTHMLEMWLDTGEAMREQLEHALTVVALATKG